MFAQKSNTFRRKSVEIFRPQLAISKKFRSSASIGGKKTDWLNVSQLGCLIYGRIRKYFPNFYLIAANYFEALQYLPKFRIICKKLSHFVDDIQADHRLFLARTIEYFVIILVGKATSMENMTDIECLSSNRPFFCHQVDSRRCKKYNLSLIYLKRQHNSSQ